MSEEVNVAARYRRHAKELRRIAAEDGDANTNAELIRIAKEYDHMAETFEAIDRTNKRVASPGLRSKP